jgi:hypothetical protein
MPRSMQRGAALQSANAALHASRTPQRLSGSVDRVTFHSEASAICVLRVKVQDDRDLLTVIGCGGVLQC